jgi:hypothetical protein
LGAHTKRTYQQELPTVEAQKTHPSLAAELEVEKKAADRLEDVGPSAEVDGGSTAVTKGDHMAGLKVECRPGGTWVERP